MGESTARQEAVEAMTLALCASDASLTEVERALDAIPAGVLARYAIERGGLEHVGWTERTREPGGYFHLHKVRFSGADLDRVYRLVEVPDA